MLLEAYRIGKFFEYIIKYYFESAELYVISRMSGSKPFDLLGIKEGCIYLYQCETEDEIKENKKLLKENGFLVVRKSKRHLYFCIKMSKVVILTIIKPGVFDLHFFKKLHQKNIRLKVIETLSDFINHFQDQESCLIIIIECKLLSEKSRPPYIDKKQLEELFKIREITGAVLWLAVKVMKNIKLLVFGADIETYVGFDIRGFL